jgi:hypothetical protein
MFRTVINDRRQCKHFNLNSKLSHPPAIQTAIQYKTCLHSANVSFRIGAHGTSDVSSDSNTNRTIFLLRLSIDILRSSFPYTITSWSESAKIHSSRRSSSGRSSKRSDYFSFSPRPTVIRENSGSRVFRMTDSRISRLSVNLKYIVAVMSCSTILAVCTHMMPSG